MACVGGVLICKAVIRLSAYQEVAIRIPEYHVKPNHGLSLISRTLVS